MYPIFYGVPFLIYCISYCFALFCWDLSGCIMADFPKARG